MIYSLYNEMTRNLLSQKYTTDTNIEFFHC